MSNLRNINIQEILDMKISILFIISHYKTITCGFFLKNSMQLLPCLSGGYNEMTRVIKELKQEGFKIDAELLRALSPYRTEHINRFGQYQVDMDTPIDHLKNDIKPEDLIST